MLQIIGFLLGMGGIGLIMLLGVAAIWAGFIGVVIRLVRSIIGEKK